jgi:hypothetical protein
MRWWPRAPEAEGEESRWSAPSGCDTGLRDCCRSLQNHCTAGLVVGNRSQLVKRRQTLPEGLPDPGDVGFAASGYILLV